jgi:glycosyltransferase involved in cell wall biosynthesis
MAIERFELGEYDLILSSSHCVAKGIVPHRTLHIAYVHAPMRYVWDQHDAYFGADAPWMGRIGMALWRRYLQRWDVRSSDRVDHFVANSGNVAAKIKTLYGRGASVIHPPVDVERFTLKNKRREYYLIVSALVPYKKLDLAIEAFNALKLPLKIAGDGPLRRSLQRRAQSNIDFLGWVDDRKLAELYSQCQALIFPGEEDFGIVPLEAQASGRPVIGYGRGGLLETVVGLDRSSSGSAPTGVFFPEHNAASLIAAIEFYQRRQGEFHPHQIREHALKFSRARFKQEIAEYLDARFKQFRRTA